MFSLQDQAYLENSSSSTATTDSQENIRSHV